MESLVGEGPMEYSEPPLLSEKENQIIAAQTDLVSGAPGQPLRGAGEGLLGDCLTNLAIDTLFDEDDLKLLDQIIATGVLSTKR